MSSLTLMTTGSRLVAMAEPTKAANESEESLMMKGVASEMENIPGRSNE